MNPIRRSIWMVVVLGASVGCAGEDTSTNPGAPATPSPSPAPAKPVVPPATKTEPAKESATKDMPPAPAKPAELPKVEGPKAEGTGKGASAAGKLSADEIATIKQLPAADQELALKQAVCPVSDGHLGEMGKPIKLTVEGRTVFLCCDGCEKEIKADPKKFLAKLDASAGKK